MHTVAYVFYFNSNSLFGLESGEILPQKLQKQNVFKSVEKGVGYNAVHPTCTSSTNKCELLKSHILTYRLPRNIIQLPLLLETHNISQNHITEIKVCP
jgi:hypothetical protein